MQKALTVSSLIDAKTVNLQTNTGVIIKGSQIQATTVNFMANFLNLISDKNSESYSSFSDSSGVLTRTIINQGYVKETAVDAKVDAQKITLNGKILLEDKLKPENLLKQLSSEYNLNEAQISQVKAELTNKEWYDKTTTLSQMGMIIVQAVVTVLTAGAGTALVTGINATVDAMVNAAINSMITQTLTQLATAAITGNKLELDVNTLLTNSLKAAALAGLTAQIDTNLGLNKDNLSFAEKSTKQILHGIATKAVYGGNLESILATSAGNVAFDYIGHSVYSNDSQFPQLRDAIPKTVIHSLVGGTLAELTGGDFSQGAINTAVSHTVAEYMDKELFEKTVKGDISKEEAKAYIKAMSSVVSGAVVLATHEKVSDKDLKIAQDMGNSVVENNAFMLIVPTMLALATYANAPDIGEKTQDGLPASILNPAIDTAVFLYDATKELLDGGVPTEAIIVALAHKYKVDEATAKNVFENVSVYVSKGADGKLQYVGITNDVARRQAEHMRTKGIDIEPIISNLSRSDAKALEQTLIELAGLEKTGGTLMNKINSISVSNPSYAEQLRRGQELLEIVNKNKGL